MSTIKISQLDSINKLNTTDILPVVNEGETKRMTVEKLGDIYATKEYVKNMTSGKLIEAYVTWGKGLDTTGEYPDEAKTIMSDVINQLNSIYGSYKTPQIRIALDASNTYQCYLEPFRIGNKYEDFYFNEYGGSFSSGDDYIHAEQYHIYPGQYQMRVQGNWNSGDFVATSVSRIKNIDYLSKSATTGSYTPQYDISPATKKYVDDSIKTAITDALGGEY